MNKAELIAAIAAKTGDTKKAAEASVNAFVEVILLDLELRNKGLNISKQLSSFRGCILFLFVLFIIPRYHNRPLNV